MGVCEKGCLAWRRPPVSRLIMFFAQVDTNAELEKIPVLSVRNQIFYSLSGLYLKRTKEISGPSCSKITMSLVNDSLKCT